MPFQLSQAETEFIDQLGLLAESGGLTRITGRIWALLIVSGEALAPAEIAELLQVSRASVGTGLKMLESLELLATRTRAGERQSYFELREKPYAAMMQAQTKRAAANIAVVQKAVDKIRRPAARRGLQDLESFYRIVLAGHLNMLAQLEESQP
jgi:DNA-binding transcriptional regulator GbsR (MarR family)